MTYTDAQRDAMLDEHTVRLGDLEAAVFSTPPIPPPWVGAYVGQQGVSSPPWQSLWDAADEAMGPLTHRRSFDSTIKPVGAEAWRKVEGPAAFYSVKPVGGDWQAFLSGAQDAQFSAMVAELPDDSALTMYHEPEDDMPGDRFAAITFRAYDLTKAANENIEYWAVNMAYQWEPGSEPGVADSAGWIDAANIADAVGVDVYSPLWDFGPIAEDRGFLRWTEEIVAASGKPWGIIERGVSRANGDTAQADVLAADWVYARSNNATTFLLWDADWTNSGKINQWQVTGDEAQAQMAAIAAEGRTA